MFKGNISFYDRKKFLQKHELWMKRKFILRKKLKFILWIFRIKEKVMLTIFGSKRGSFST